MFQFVIPQRGRTLDAKDHAGTGSPEVVVKEESNLVFELHGSQFESRATDRATKKFKQKNFSDL